MSIISKIFTGKENKNAGQSLETISNPIVRMHLLEARQSYKNGDYQQALLHCHEVLSSDPTNADAYRIRGVTRYQLQDPIGAAEDFQSSLKFASL